MFNLLNLLHHQKLGIASSREVGLTLRRIKHTNLLRDTSHYVSKSIVFITNSSKFWNNDNFVLFQEDNTKFHLINLHTLDLFWTYNISFSEQSLNNIEQAELTIDGCVTYYSHSRNHDKHFFRIVRNGQLRNEFEINNRTFDGAKDTVILQGKKIIIIFCTSPHHHVYEEYDLNGQLLLSKTFNIPSYADFSFPLDVKRLEDDIFLFTRGGVHKQRRLFSVKNEMEVDLSFAENLAKSFSSLSASLLPEVCETSLIYYSTAEYINPLDIQYYVSNYVHIHDFAKNQTNHILIDCRCSEIIAVNDRIIVFLSDNRNTHSVYFLERREDSTAIKLEGINAFSNQMKTLLEEDKLYIFYFSSTTGGRGDLRLYYRDLSTGNTFDREVFQAVVSFDLNKGKLLAVTSTNQELKLHVKDYNVVTPQRTKCLDETQETITSQNSNRSM